MSNIIPFPRRPKLRGFALLVSMLNLVDCPDSEEVIFWMGGELYAFATDHPEEERIYRPLIEKRPEGPWQDGMGRWP